MSLSLQSALKSLIRGTYNQQLSVFCPPIRCRLSDTLISWFSPRRSGINPRTFYVGTVVMKAAMEQVCLTCHSTNSPYSFVIRDIWCLAFGLLAGASLFYNLWSDYLEINPINTMEYIFLLRRWWSVSWWRNSAHCMEPEGFVIFAFVACRLLLAWRTFRPPHMDAVRSSETSVNFWWPTWRYISEYSTLYGRRCEDLKSKGFLLPFAQSWVQQMNLRSL
jgi:hypothetical protein